MVRDLDAGDMPNTAKKVQPTSGLSGSSFLSICLQWTANLPQFWQATGKAPKWFPSNRERKLPETSSPQEYFDLEANG
jgi:hypothetical protein